MEDFNKVIEINPSHERAYFNRGVTKTHLNDYNGAISDYNKSIEINPAFVDAYYNRGVMKMYLNDMDGAYLDFDKASDLGDKIAAQFIERYWK